MGIGRTLGNIGGGALAGASAGSALGPFGAGGGALLGGILGALGQGKNKKTGDIPGYDKYSTFNPQQKALFEQLSSMLGGRLGGGQDDRVSAPYMRQFQEETVPGLAERFAGLGAGSQSSSAFQQALGAAGAGLSEKLAALNAGQEQNAINQILQLLGMNTESIMEQQAPWWQSFLGGAAPSIGQGVGLGLGQAAQKGFGGLFGSGKGGG